MDPVVPKPGSSMERVVKAAQALGLDVELRVMDQSTRTAQDAARACGCKVDQIVKSLVFENAETGGLALVLISGAHDADIEHLKRAHGLHLKRADGRRVRDETGFAIGGVAPIGHKAPIAVWMDNTLLGFGDVWAAAGRPDSVFRVDPRSLVAATHASVIDVRP
ncbi:MAG: YbaK/EbsC family protein [Pseudomonadota bacterium]